MYPIFPASPVTGVVTAVIVKLNWGISAGLGANL